LFSIVALKIIFPKIGSRDWELVLNILPNFKFRDYIIFLKYAAIKCILYGPDARLPALQWQPFCAPLVGVVMSAPKYEIDRTTQY